MPGERLEKGSRDMNQKQAATEKVSNTSTIELGDRVRIDGDVQAPGIIVVDGYLRSLVEFAAAPESRCSMERAWYDNGRLLVTERHEDLFRGSEPESVKVIK